MKTGKLSTVLVALMVAALFMAVIPTAGAETVPEGYPAVINGLDFGGDTVYIYDWWSTGERVNNPTEAQQRQYDYWDWIETTYHVHVVQEALADWGSIYDALAEIVRTSNNSKLCIVAVRGSDAGTVLRNNLYMPWNYDLNSGNTATQNLMTIGDNCYATCWDSKSEPRQGVFFNKAVLEAAGITWSDIYTAQNNGTWTWAKMEEYMSIVQRDTNHDDEIDVWGLTGNGDDITIGLVVSNGAEFYDYNDSGELVPAIDSIEMREALERRQSWKSFIAPSEGWNGYQTNWKTGKAAFMIGQTYEGFSSNSNWDFEWGFVAMPKGPKKMDHYATTVENNIYGVPNVYDSETSLKLQKLFRLWTYELPDTDNSWAVDFADLTDRNAIATYGMLREPENGTSMKYDLLGGRNMAATEILWSINDGTVDQIISNALPAFQSRCDEFNPEQIEWTLNDGVLIISGMKKMKTHPWTERASEIVEVVINEGVSSICSDAFKNCVNMTIVRIPSTMDYIDDGAFSGCTSLADVYYNGLEVDWDGGYVLPWGSIDNRAIETAAKHFRATSPAGEAYPVTLTARRIGEEEPLASDDDGLYSAANYEYILFSFSAPDMEGYTKGYRFRNHSWEIVPETDAVTGVDGFSSRIYLGGTGEDVSVTAMVVYYPANLTDPVLISSCDMSFNVSHQPCGITVSGPETYSIDSIGYPLTITVPEGTETVGAEWYIDCIYFVNEEDDNVYFYSTGDNTEGNLHTGENVIFVPTGDLPAPCSCGIGFSYTGVGYDSFFTSIDFDVVCIAINETVFPDENFRSYVRSFDTNNDGILSPAEIQAVTTINCSNEEIASLEGIRVFTALEYLDCRSNSLTELDVGELAALVSLDCSSNQIESLNLSGCMVLQQLRCGNNKLTALNVSDCYALNELHCSFNQIAVLDVSSSEDLCNALAQNARTSEYGKEHWSFDFETPDRFGDALSVDYFTTVTGGEVTSLPLMNTVGGSEANAFDIPATLDLGEGLEFELQAPAGTERSLVFLYYMNGGIPELVNTQYTYPNQSGMAYVWISYSSYLVRPGEYRLLVQSFIRENGSEQQAVTIKAFTVEGTVPDAPQVIAEALTVVKDSDVRFEIRPSAALAGATVGDVRYFRTGPNERSETGYAWGDHTEDGYLVYEERMYTPGEWTYSFSAEIDGIWSEYSDPVVITCESLGKLDAPEWAEVPDTLIAGEPLCIDFGHHDPVERYYIEVTSSDEGGYWNCSYIYDSGYQETFRYGLSEGTYTVIIRAYSDGYEDSDWSAGKQVTVTGSRPPVPALKGPSGTHYSGDRVWITIQAEGLEAVAETYSASEIYLSNGNTCYYPITASWPDYVRTYYLRAKIDGRWTDNFPVAYMGTERQGNDDTLLNVSDFPQSIQLGQGLTFRTELPEGNPDYMFSISYILEENVEEEYKKVEQIVYDYFTEPDEQGVWTIPAMFFTKAGEYDIGMDIRGAGVNQYCTKRLTVTNNPNRPEAPAVTMLSEPPLVQYADVEFRISAPNAQKACLIIRDADEENAVAYNPFVIDMDDGACTFTFNKMNFDGSMIRYSLSASVYDGTSWSAYSEPVTFTFAKTTGSLQGRSNMITIDPEEAVAGDMLTINWLPVRGAEKYKVVLDWDDVIYFGDGVSDGYTCTLNTEGLAKDEHDITVWAYAAGKDYVNDYRRFILLDPDAKPAVQANRIGVQKNEPVTLTIRSTVGDFIFVYVDDDFALLSLRDPSGIQEAVLRLSSVGTHTIRVYTAFNTNDPYSVASDPLLIRVHGEADMALPASLERIEQGAFADVKDVTISVPGELTDVAEDAIDKSVTILAPANSPAAVWFREHGYTVIEE